MCHFCTRISELTKVDKHGNRELQSVMSFMIEECIRNSSDTKETAISSEDGN